ncbi:MAG: diaminopimelate decarboxylase [Deltaproteobacteria bacterium]|nr:diaminopimelate decarboxylase [Deltaproteobacteria bacterium]
MHHFQYKGNELYCEGVAVERITKEVGTPFYLYSNATLEHHFKVFDEVFSDVPHITCYAVKANSNIAILDIFGRLGGGADIVSGGELFRALRAGMSPDKIVYSGVGKKVDEIDFALKSDILMFNVESPQELRVINDRAGALGKKARIAIRVNPDVDPKTHPYISTGLKKSKFGIDIKRALDEYRNARELKNIEIAGVDCHIGSQITEIGPFKDAVRKIKELVLTMKSEGFEIKYLDLGGGLGIPYNAEEPPHPFDYGKTLMEGVSDLGCTLILEPGRVIVGNAGILVTKVLYTKEGEEKSFVIVDAGMNDMIRPSIYGSFHFIQPVIKEERKDVMVDVVGPICESGDFLAKERQMPEARPGELLAVMSAGAYGFAMASNYNSRPRVAEILVQGDQYHVIRKREGYEDLIRMEKIPD